MKIYQIEKKTTRGWAPIYQTAWRLVAWWFVRKYLNKYDGAVLRRVTHIIKKVK